jgi:aryl-alcohol dehydrogenase-like predicted oxidoreductase
MVIDLLARIGARKQAMPAQVALAWLLAQKPWIVPIPGSRKIERLEENIGAIQVELTESDLSDEEMAQIADLDTNQTLVNHEDPDFMKRLFGRLG